MKTTLLISIFSILSSHFLIAQSDTLTGVLRDSKEKAIKRYEVRLGSSPGTTVKTDKNGVFVFADANLQDTLYVEMNKTGKTVKVPVSGYTFLTIQLKEGSFEVDHRYEPDENLKKVMERESKKMISSSTLNKEEILKTRCQDIYCLLRRLSGVMVQNSGAVRIRGGASFNSSSNALIVVNGIPMQDSGIMRTIPIQDIEEITVLKDATQYGAMGANGAIVIKTGK